MSLLALENLTVRRGDAPTVAGASLALEAGECVGLIGPNGAGKSSLMRAALGLTAFEGASSLAALPARARARAASYLPQGRELAWAMSVEAVAGLGRLPHLTPGARFSAADHAAVERALARMALSPLRHRTATHLSGGEQARVLIARALAQEAPLLLADEPVAGLDPAHQIGAMALFAQLAAEGRAALVAIHDLGLAARFCTRLILMERGRIVADGAPMEVLTPERLAAVFGVTAYFAETESGPVLQPMAAL